VLNLTKILVYPQFKKTTTSSYSYLFFRLINCGRKNHGGARSCAVSAAGALRLAAALHGGR
jgi:hypothetical protein